MTLHVVRNVQLSLRSKVLLMQIKEYSNHRKSIGVEDNSSVIYDLARHCLQPNMTEITKQDINSFRDLLLSKKTPYAAINAMKAIRSFFRFHKTKKVCCIDAMCITDDGVYETFSVNCDSLLLNMAKKHNTVFKMERNRDLVYKRISDPKKWTWGVLGDNFGITRERACEAFRDHALKFITPKEMAQYKVKLAKLSKESYPHLKLAEGC